MLSVKQEGIKYHFWVFGMTRSGIELGSPGLISKLLNAALKGPRVTFYPGLGKYIFYPCATPNLR